MKCYPSLQVTMVVSMLSHGHPWLGWFGGTTILGNLQMGLVPEKIGKKQRRPLNLIWDMHRWSQWCLGGKQGQTGLICFTTRWLPGCLPGWQCFLRDSCCSGAVSKGILQELHDADAVWDPWNIHVSGIFMDFPYPLIVNTHGESGVRFWCCGSPVVTFSVSIGFKEYDDPWQRDDLELLPWQNGNLHMFQQIPGGCMIFGTIHRSVALENSNAAFPKVWDSGKKKWGWIKIIQNLLLPYLAE